MIGEFGYRFLADEAEAAGQAMSGRTAWRICAANSWWSSFGKKPGPPVHDDLVERDFTADSPNKLWLTDITEHWTDEGKLYLCAIKDACPERIVGYSIDSRMQSRLAVAAVNSAVARRDRDVDGCVVHSDRGSQFRSRRFVFGVNRHGLVGSMGRVSAAGDNAAMESFFALLQRNVLDRQRWATREQLRDRDRHLDRTDLPPPPAASPPRPVDAHRIRDDHQHSRLSGMTPNLSLSVQQSQTPSTFSGWSSIS